MARKKKRKLPVFLAVIVLIIVILGVMVKWNSGYTESVSGSANAYNKFKDVLISGGTVSLSSDDINSLVANSFEAQTHRGVTIKTIYVNMPQDKLDIKIPVAYKGQNFLVSSSGKVALKDGCIAYLPDSFKVGAIPLPKNFILNKLKTMYSSKFTIETDGIYINKSALPVTVNSVKIENSNLKIGVEKLKLNLNNSRLSQIKNKLENVVGNLNESDKSKVENIIKYIDNNQSSQNALQDLKSKLGSVSNNEVKKIANEINVVQNNNFQNQNQNQNQSQNKGTKSVDSALAGRVSSQLAAAAGDVSDGSARAVINSIQSQVDSGSISSGSVMAQYKALNSYQRFQVQAAIFKHVNISDAEELRREYGI